MSGTCCTNAMATGALLENECRPSAPEEAGTKRVEHFKPAVDVYETPEAYFVELDVPGATRESVDIEFEKGALSVGVRIPQRSPAGARMLRCEYGVGDYQRDFRIGEAIDPTAIDASLKDGVLTVRLPKSIQNKAHRIEVRTN